MATMRQDETMTEFTLRRLREDWEAPLRLRILELEMEIAAALAISARHNSPVFHAISDTLRRALQGGTKRE